MAATVLLMLEPTRLAGAATGLLIAIVWSALAIREDAASSHVGSGWSYNRSETLSGLHNKMRGAHVFGRKWDTGAATIVAMNAKKKTSDGRVITWEYVADVAVPSQPVFRAVVQEPTLSPNFMTPRTGAVVAVLVHQKSCKVKFDTSDPQLDRRTILRTFQASSQSAFERAAAAPPGTQG